MSFLSARTLLGMVVAAGVICHDFTDFTYSQRLDVSFGLATSVQPLVWSPLQYDVR